MVNKRKQSGWRSKKQLSAGLLVLLLLLAGCSGGEKPAAQEEEAEAPAPKRVRVASSIITQWGEPVVVDAQLLPSQHVQLAAELSATVKEVLVQRGDQVEKGQKLLTLDTKDWQLGLEQAQLARKRAELQISQSDQDLAQAQRSGQQQVEQAQIQFDSLFNQLKTMQESGQADEAQLEMMRDQVEQAEKAVKLAEQALQDLGQGSSKELLQTAIAEADLGIRQAEQQLQRAALHTYAAGEVVAVDVQPGQTVGPGQVLFTVQQLNPLKVEAAITEQAWLLIKDKPVLAVEIPILEQRLEAAVLGMEAASVNGQAGFKLELSLDNAEGQLRPGLRARLILDEDQVSDVVAVPVGAVLEGEAGSYVFLVDGNTAKRQAVETGRQFQDWVEIASGVTADQTLIVVGHSMLDDGDTIEVVE